MTHIENHTTYGESSAEEVPSVNVGEEEMVETSRSTSAPRPMQVLARLAIPVALLAAGVAAFLYLSVEPAEEKAEPAKKQEIRTRVAELRVIDYPVVVKTNGIVQPHNEVALSSEVSGLVTAISTSFEVGSYFKAGEVLVELDSRDYKTAVAVAEANKLGAESALELATETYERNQKLHKKNGVSDAVLKQSFAAKAQAKAQLDTATAQLERADRDLSRAKIVAPFDGRVRMKNIGIGQSVGVGSPLGVVFAVDYAEVRLPIASKELQYLDLPELATDSPVDVTLTDGITESEEVVWSAQIVRTEGTLDVNSLELFVIARIDDPFGRKSGHPPLRIGQPVIAAIQGKKLNDVVKVPRTAVRQLDQVYFVDKDALTLSGRTLEPVWSDEEFLIVQDPTIQDGQLLATTRIVFAPDGAKVEIIPEIAEGENAADSTDETISATKTKSTSTTTKPVSN